MQEILKIVNKMGDGFDVNPKSFLSNFRGSRHISLKIKVQK